jgi:hypothetical protein
MIFSVKKHLGLQSMKKGLQRLTNSFVIPVPSKENLILYPNWLIIAK